MTDSTDNDLKRELLRLDILLRKKQSWWEHPRNFAVILGVIAAIAGIFGYCIGAAPQQIIVHLDQPLSVKP
jgi:hypothetical protein